MDIVVCYCEELKDLINIIDLRKFLCVHRGACSFYVWFVKLFTKLLKLGILKNKLVDLSLRRSWKSPVIKVIGGRRSKHRNTLVLWKIT